MNRTKKFFSLAILLLFLLTSVFQIVSAQTYRFQVPSSNVNVYVNPDGTLKIEYMIEFLNDANADPIDFVDIGLPNENYSINDIQADINGITISDITKSPYVDHGVALGLGSNAIRPGQTGTVHFVVNSVSEVLYPSTEKEQEKYASLKFSPNYFGSEYVYGNTNMTVTIFLPAGMTDQEPRYYPPDRWPGEAQPNSGFDAEGRVFYKWYSNQADSHTEYIFGSFFPARLVPETAIVTKPAFSIDQDTLCCFGFGAIFIGFMGLITYASIWGQKKRKMQYLPPKIAIEGHGVKRGLTAIEAAILMEQPMDKVLTMVLFSVIKKGAASVISRDPLKLVVEKVLPDDLRPYETDFLKAFALEKDAQRRKALQDMMVNLIKSVSEKMKGFSRKESIAYYESIMEKAWEQVQGADTPEVQMQKYDEVMGWTMLDRKFEDRTQEVFRTRPVYVPMWWGRYDPGFGGSGTGSIGSAKPVSSSSGSGGGSISMPTLPGSDFAVSMVGGIQSFSSNVVGNLTSFTEGITKTTNPLPKPSSSSYRGGGGGGGCACACACAGCACACAGGGR